MFVNIHVLCMIIFYTIMADDQRYKDRVTIITGGSSGIGEGCVSVFGNCFFKYLFMHYYQTNETYCFFSQLSVTHFVYRYLFYCVIRENIIHTEATFT
jgi:hypothetical protein